MVIKASAAAEIRVLVDALVGTDDVRREAAAARLRVIGARAVERLLDAYARSSNDGVRLTILRVLEPIGDPRAIAPARHALADGGDLAVMATQVMRGLLDVADQGVRSDALDALVTVALDESVARPVRRAAVDALRDMPAEARARVEVALGADPVEAIGARVPAGDDARAIGDVWTDAVAGRLPDRPHALAAVVASTAASASLQSLQKLVDVLKARESSAGGDAAEWRAVRGSVHQALAQRGSRVALYDLRESFADATAPLPVSFLAAVNTIGDASCLEPLAAAWAHAAASEEWWRGQLAAAFRAVMKREKLTKRSAAVKKVEKKWPGAAAITST